MLWISFLLYSDERLNSIFDSFSFKTFTKEWNGYIPLNIRHCTMEEMYHFNLTPSIIITETVPYSHLSSMWTPCASNNPIITILFQKLIGSFSTSYILAESQVNKVKSCYILWKFWENILSNSLESHDIIICSLSWI